MDKWGCCQLRPCSVQLPAVDGNHPILPTDTLKPLLVTWQGFELMVSVCKSLVDLTFLGALGDRFKEELANAENFNL